MNRKRPRKHPRTKPVATSVVALVPDPVPEPAPEASVTLDHEPIDRDMHCYLAIGLAVGALAVVAAMIVLIMMAAN